MNYYEPSLSGHRRQRIFQTRWFAKAARKAGVTSHDLCAAGRALAIGQGDDLGGGVWKKRLLGNRLRSIVLVQGPQGWTFVYLFAKADQENISAQELRWFKRLAVIHHAFAARELQRALDENAMIEVICE